MWKLTALVGDFLFATSTPPPQQQPSTPRKPADTFLGTQVADPIEYESVKSALTGPGRKENVFLGSVKDNIGHAEAASGAAGVIKTLLIMQKGTIPKQANFATLNPKIKASDQIVVPQQTQPWTSSRHVALVNNYGAAGSNAAIILRAYKQPRPAPQRPSPTAYPVVLSAKSAASVRLYLRELERFVRASDGISLRDIAYSLARRQNPSFEHRVAFVAGDMADFRSDLERLNAKNEEAVITRASNRPVVLAFGGQTGRTVTVSRQLYEAGGLFRRHLVGLLVPLYHDFLFLFPADTHSRTNAKPCASTLACPVF